MVRTITHGKRGQTKQMKKKDYVKYTVFLGKNRRKRENGRRMCAIDLTRGVVGSRSRPGRVVRF